MILIFLCSCFLTRSRRGSCCRRRVVTLHDARHSTSTPVYSATIFTMQAQK